MNKTDWGDHEPTRADRIFGWILAALLVCGSAYFGAHLLVSFGVGCGN